MGNGDARGAYSCHCKSIRAESKEEDEEEWMENGPISGVERGRVHNGN